LEKSENPREKKAKRNRREAKNFVGRVGYVKEKKSNWGGQDHITVKRGRSEERF